MLCWDKESELRPSAESSAVTGMRCAAAYQQAADERAYLLHTHHAPASGALQYAGLTAPESVVWWCAHLRGSVADLALGPRLVHRAGLLDANYRRVPGPDGPGR